MYKFIDVTETPEGALPPSEALQINGEYIEDLIPGYRTLTVEGREALSPELSIFETGIRDGALVNGKRYPARTIRITYQLVAESNEAFREKFNKLGKILAVEGAVLIFNDEPDKYFVGTPCRIGEVMPGRNSVVGEFDILCLDPFKYSVMEYEAAAEPGESSIFIDYNGTYKSFPKLQALFHQESEASDDGETVKSLTGDGECGYVAFFNERKKIIQLGNPDETDGDDAGYPASQTLINEKFNSANSWGTAAKSQWSVNNGITAESRLQVGTPGMGAATVTGGTSLNDVYYNEVLAVVSKAEHPYIHYNVWVSATRRRANLIDVTVTVKTHLDNKLSYFGSGYELRCNVRCGSATNALKLKDVHDYWRTPTEHSSSCTFKNVSISEGKCLLPEISIEVTRPDGLGNTGVLPKTVCSGFTVPAYIKPSAETHYLTAADFGTGKGWHGATISRAIPRDATGATATNFNLSFCAKIYAADSEETGAFSCMVSNGGKVLAGIDCYKSSGTTAKLCFYVNGRIVETVSVKLTVDINAITGAAAAAFAAVLQPNFAEQAAKAAEAARLPFTENTSVSIRKNGGKITFTVGKDISKTYNAADISTKTADSVTIGFFKYEGRTPLAYNGLCWLKFVKDNCETWKDIPNKFKTNDIVEADCSTGEITLNGSAAHTLGALGNDWEGFYLSPGLNQIGTAYSEWVSEGFEPTFKVKYREVYL